MSDKYLFSHIKSALSFALVLLKDRKNVISNVFISLPTRNQMQINSSYIKNEPRKGTDDQTYAQVQPRQEYHRGR